MEGDRLSVMFGPGQLDGIQSLRLKRQAREVLTYPAVCVGVKYAGGVQGPGRPWDNVAFSWLWQASASWVLEALKGTVDACGLKTLNVC